VRKAMEITAPGKICLLSPAAASYDMFKNFEVRGDAFQKLVKGE
jgi:UDP-N-acetylmuramoylalanine--D-glutamate ligase